MMTRFRCSGATSYNAETSCGVGGMYRAATLVGATGKSGRLASEWQNRPLKPIYSIIFMDALFLKMRMDGRVRNVAAHMMIGITITGEKECIGIWLSQNESSKVWLGILNELKNRGVNDILIFAVDGLTGFPEAIRAAYPDSDVQRCIVHQIRNSLSRPGGGHGHLGADVPGLARGLDGVVYHGGRHGPHGAVAALEEEAALLAFDSFENEWGKRYPQVVSSWKRNWAELSTFFRYPDEIRRLIYTTNPIESLNSRVRKTIKGKNVFPTEASIFKILYLAVQEAEKHWTMKVKEWPQIIAQLSIYYEEKLQKYLP
ncbi:IS256 family transposase [uncultured Desulfovibrio sp.]|uniref:IS256 family transposase n=1 Tax=uncultured Desulfovibrio sp. TaxID=167968 RepID=UPI00260725F7|nr:IS256 family transposase [uncultured Desulfovibrio sp.]